MYIYIYMPRKGEEGPEAVFSARGPREPGGADWDTSDEEIMKMTGPNGTHSQKFLKSISKVSQKYLVVALYGVMKMTRPNGTHSQKYTLDTFSKGLSLVPFNVLGH
jgi:hypothetical protein